MIRKWYAHESSKFEISEWLKQKKEEHVAADDDICADFFFAFAKIEIYMCVL